ncbi:type 2 isopentenyl-diphosphate Delta-isomerase [Thermogladius sp.]|uniref:type 2 isopentenyl-diphosphate Delta-isomerase n=1 Tax=Thermogladius sp. TaxID=2023064 RepID=UPI003D14980C
MRGSLRCSSLVVDHLLRKLSHIDVVLTKDVDHPDHCKQYFDSVVLVHQAFPALRLEDVDLRVKFLKYEVNAPVMITGMTGGHPEVYSVNEKLATIAEVLRIPIGVGSMRPVLVKRGDTAVAETYKIVRRVARDVPVIGNIGAVNLPGLDEKVFIDLVNEFELDALAVHLNPAQEVVQPEGETGFTVEVVEAVVRLAKAVGVPLIVKEVGNGLSMETVSVFYSKGIRMFDVAGACGTNWVSVEKYRLPEGDLRRVVAEALSSWGIPTPAAIVEARYVAPDATIIASGGVWDGLRAAKSISLGADLVGLAKPLLKTLLLEGYERALKFMEAYIHTLKTVMFLTSSRNTFELRRRPVVILSPLLEYLKQRGIDVNEYVMAR